MVTVLSYVLDWNKYFGGLMSVEKPGTKASNSEIRRWIDQGAIQINTESWKQNEEMPPMVWSFILFPKSSRKRTTVI